MGKKKKISELHDADLYHYRHKQDEKLYGEYMKARFAILDHEIHDKKNYLRAGWFRTRNDSMKGLMDFPTHEMTVGEDTCLVYEIPPERMQEALDKANPYKGVLYFPAQCYRNAIIIYFHGYNFILKPRFFETGETPEGWGLSKEDFIKISNTEKGTK